MNSMITNVFRNLTKYNEGWKQSLGIDDSAYLSALVAVDRVQRIAGPITSVVDLGCGRGQWLAAFKQVTGCAILGIDHKFYRKGWIAPDEYKRADLTKIGRMPVIKADLAISVEVGEHLPQVEGRYLVMNLCTIAPAVLFSAATPGQGGLGHINERPHEYWDELFALRGYSIATKFTDLKFPQCPWYEKNMRLYLSNTAIPETHEI